jgi:L-amino acid N-acyltransferase YncA
MSAALLIPALQTRAIIRPLTVNDCSVYRALRKKILETGEGKYFSDSYLREQKFATEKQWNDWCDETQKHCIMGTFIGGSLVGVMMITMQEPAESSTVEWEATYLEPEYRRSGIARLSYQKVLEWTINAGYKHAVVYIRDDNTRSREIREKQGFIYQGTKRNEVWADGSVEDSHFYMLNLNEPYENGLYKEAIRKLESTCLFHDHEVPVMDKAI